MKAKKLKPEFIYFVLRPNDNYFKSEPEYISWFEVHYYNPSEEYLEGPPGERVANRIWEGILVFEKFFSREDFWWATVLPSPGSSSEVNDLLRHHIRVPNTILQEALQNNSLVITPYGYGIEGKWVWYKNGTRNILRKL